METSNCNKDDVVQLTKIEKSADGEDILYVDINAVKSVLGNPEYKDYYAAVYTIAGPTSTGKSFLLSLLSSFLGSNSGQNFHQWSQGKEQLKKIFEWKRGPNSHTKGIFIIKKPHFGGFRRKNDCAVFGRHARIWGSYYFRTQPNLSWNIQSYIKFSVDL